MRPAHRWRLAIVTIVVMSALPRDVIAAVGPCWTAPVDAPVSDPYRAPRCRWCSGNRGIEYRTGTGVAVKAVASGRVSFVGSVAGTTYLVVRHADGVRATYGNISGVRFRAGQLVIRGMRVGSTAGRFHFGLRRGDQYLDPTPFIGRLVHRPRLIPANGDRPAPGPDPVLTCRSKSVGPPVGAQSEIGAMRIQS